MSSSKGKLAFFRDKYIPVTVWQWVRIYLAALFFFTIFRLILFFSEIGRIDSTVSFRDIFLTFVMGIRFDIVISGYILILPYLVLSIITYLNYKYLLFSKIVLYFISILFTLAFVVCAVDIPYFKQFFARFSVTAFEWIDHPRFVFKMIAQEPRYWLVILPLFLFIFIFIRIIRRIFRSYRGTDKRMNIIKPVVSVVFLGLIFLGIRGRIEEKSPIRVGTAYRSNNAFLNQLGLNPNFTLMVSYLDSRKEENRSIRLMDDRTAIANVRKYLNIQTPDDKLPLLRIKFSNGRVGPARNVVLVIMESMAAAKLGSAGKFHTPVLDSISKNGYTFTNAYTAGIHTFNGIFSSLFSFPALFRQHPMKEAAMLKYHGIFTTLKNLGYSTAYFTTHDGQFDNVEGFLKANDCETVISQTDYPADKIKTTLGVPDDYMFEFSIPILNGLYRKNKPFVAAFMTASDHGPYYIPEYFRPSPGEIREQIVEYADYSIGKFLHLASQQDWFRNTIFVFVADHGAPLDGLYDMSIDYNHTPLIFYGPEVITKPQVFNNMAGQIDIFPSIMHLLNLPYVNNTLGTDLFSETRPYIFFNADDKYGVIDNDWFLVVRNDHTRSLYKYRDRDTRNYAAGEPGIVSRMDEYARSNMQLYQHILLTHGQ